MRKGRLLKQEMFYCTPPISQSRCQLLWENILTSTSSPVGMTPWKHKKQILWETSCSEVVKPRAIYCKHNSAMAAIHSRHLYETLTLKSSIEFSFRLGNILHTSLLCNELAIDRWSSELVFGLYIIINTVLHLKLWAWEFRSICGFYQPLCEHDRAKKLLAVIT